MTQEIVNSEKCAFGCDKVDRYGWTVADQPGEFMYLPKQSLIVPPEYQRDFENAKVLKIVKNWSWIGCGVICVAWRDGCYWVIDGQHRLCAALRRSDVLSVPCIVFKTNSLAEEAAGFIRLNTERKPLASLSRFKALVVAGDPSAIGVKALLKDLGITPTSTLEGAMRLKSVGILMKLFAENPPRLRRVLTLAARLSKESDAPIKEIVIAGLFYLDKELADTPNGINDERLRLRLINSGMAAIERGIAKARAYYVQGGARIYAKGILDLANKGLRNPFKMAGAGGEE